MNVNDSFLGKKIWKIAENWCSSFFAAHLGDTKLGCVWCFQWKIRATPETWWLLIIIFPLPNGYLEVTFSAYSICRRTRARMDSYKICDRMFLGYFQPECPSRSFMHQNINGDQHFAVFKSLCHSAAMGKNEASQLTIIPIIPNWYWIVQLPELIID